MAKGTVRFHRGLKAPPARVYRAFLDSEAMVKWLPPHSFTGTVQARDARAGGSYRRSFTSVASGARHSFGRRCLELAPDPRIVHTDGFDDPNLPGEMTTTIELRPVACGTELSIVQEGIPEVIPTEMGVLGWQESQALLALLVEPDLPG